jgi:hypothetical protein
MRRRNVGVIRDVQDLISGAVIISLSVRSDYKLNWGVQTHDD